MVRLMIRGALVFFILAIIAGLYGFLGDANVVADLAKVLFVGFLILCVVFLIMAKRLIRVQGRLM